MGVAAVAGRAWAIVTSVDGSARRLPANDLDRLAAAEGRPAKAGLLAGAGPRAVQQPANLPLRGSD